MRNLLFSLALTGLLALDVAAARADTFALDPGHSGVNFKISHLGLSWTYGRFNHAEGTFILDPANPARSSFSFTVHVESLDTNSKQRDDHLRSPDFFDIEKFPAITFEAKEVKKDGNQQVLVGRFTMHGVTKDLSLPVTIKGPIKDPWGNMRVGLEASTKLNRKDYGLTWNKVLEAGGVMVGEDVSIQINAEFVKQAAEKK